MSVYYCRLVQFFTQLDLLAVWILFVSVIVVVLDGFHFPAVHHGECVTRFFFRRCFISQSVTTDSFGTQSADSSPAYCVRNKTCFLRY